MCGVVVVAPNCASEGGGVSFEWVVIVATLHFMCFRSSF